MAGVKTPGPMQLLAGLNFCAILSLLFQVEQATAGFLPDETAFWFWQSSVVAGNWLYIDGGEIWGRWKRPKANASAVWNEQTFAIDLSKSWTIDNVTPVVTNKTSDMVLNRRPDMWYDEKVDMVYSMGGISYEFGGFPFDIETPTHLWGFKPSSDGSVKWEIQNFSPNSQSATLGKSPTGGALKATTPTGHYALGGYIEWVNVQPDGAFYAELAMEQFFTYNSGNQSWFNNTLPGQHYLHGEGQYVPIYGEEGVILFFGGAWPTDRTVDGRGALKGLDNILVYDIHTNRFYNQPATNPPEIRELFCSVSTGIGNNGSYEIFIFGGTQYSVPSSTTANDLASVWILTLPSFTWIKSPDPAPAFISNHACSLIGHRQMLSIGGLQNHGASLQAVELQQDTRPNGLAIFDMSTLKWKTDYDAQAAKYEQPDLVKGFYATNDKYPKTWADSDLKALFVKGAGTKGSSATDSTSSGSPTPTLTPTPSAAANSEGTNVGAIVGGVVGGLAVLGVIAGVAFFLWRQKRRAKLVEKELDAEHSEPKQYFEAPGDFYAEEIGRGKRNVEMATTANYHETEGTMRFELGGGVTATSLMANTSSDNRARELSPQTAVSELPVERS